MSVEQHTLSGIRARQYLLRIFTVPVGAVGNTGFILEQTLHQTCLTCLGATLPRKPGHSDGVGATATATQLVIPTKSSDSDGGVEELLFCRATPCAMPLAFEQGDMNLIFHS